MLCYGLCSNATDGYCKTGDNTAIKATKRFCVAVGSEFEEYHLRQPTQSYFENQFAVNKAHGFLDHLSSHDCIEVFVIHYDWHKSLYLNSDEFSTKV